MSSLLSQNAFVPQELQDSNQQLMCRTWKMRMTPCEEHDSVKNVHVAGLSEGKESCQMFPPIASYSCLSGRD